MNRRPARPTASLPADPAETIRRLVEGTLPDPDGGPALAVPTRAVVVADSLAGDEADLVAALGPFRSPAVVSDRVTHEVMGARIERALSRLGRVTGIVLPADAHPDDATAERVRRAAAGADVLVAVGSGTINDLCKYAAARDGKTCAVFATAPSMNGFTSVNAAITVAGHKKSLPAVAPAGVFVELGVLAKAPARMIRAGLGDSLCRPTAQADWLLSHLLLGTPYREAPFALLAADEPALVEEAGALVAGDLRAMERLVRTLILSGFGMTLAGGSHPASQGEHLISHYAEMMGDPAWPATLHGEQIGVTTLTMARLQERMLDGGPPRLGATRATEADLVAHFGPELGAACRDAFAPKRLDAARAESLSARLAAAWPAIQARIARAMRPAHAIERALEAAGAPVAPAGLGWTAGFYRDAVLHARFIRDRFTFLDLADDGGRLAALGPAA